MPEHAIRSARSVPILALLTALLSAMFAAPAGADIGRDGSHPKIDGLIGVRLLEAATSRMDDPRARTYIDDHVNPGTTFSRRFAVENTSGKPQDVQIYPAAATIQKGIFTFAPGRTQNDLTTWITLDRAKLRLRPHSQETVRAKISVPPNAVRGEQYAVIWAEVASAPPGPRGNIALINRVGIRTYLDVGPGGEPPSDFTINGITTERTDDDHPKVTAMVNNTGERALDISGRLDLFDGPSGLRAGPFRITQSTTLAPGQQGTVAAVLAGGDDLPDGPWKFRLTLQSGRVTRTTTGSLTFKPGNWTASLDSPLPLALAAIGVVAGVGLIITASVLRRRRNRVRAA
ncbi:MAG: hypothetical protein ACRDOO_22435 [Actinomadura sp.]